MDRKKKIRDRAERTVIFTYTGNIKERTGVFRDNLDKGYLESIERKG